MSRRSVLSTVCGTAWPNSNRMSEQGMNRLSDFFPRRRVRRLVPLAFLLAVLSVFPVQPVWQWSGLAAQLPSQVQVDSLSGSIWRGEGLVTVRHNGLPLQLQLSWRLGLSSLWQQGALITLDLRHPGTHLTLSATPDLSFTGASGQLSGHLHPLLLNPVLKQNNAWISGEIRVTDLTWQVSGGRPAAVNGAVIWQGGDTYFINPANPDRPQLIPYPQLALKVTTGADRIIAARAVALGQSEPLVQVQLQPDGWLNAVVYGRLKQAVPKLPVPVKPADQPLVKYKEKVF